MRSGVSAPTNGDRLGEADHPVLHRDADRRLSLLSGRRADTESGTDQVLVSADRGLDVVASAVSGRSLPADAASLGDELNVAVASGL